MNSNYKRIALALAVCASSTISATETKNKDRYILYGLTGVTALLGGAVVYLFKQVATINGVSQIVGTSTAAGDIAILKKSKSDQVELLASLDRIIQSHTSAHLNFVTKNELVPLTEATAECKAAINDHATRINAHEAALESSNKQINVLHDMTEACFKRITCKKELDKAHEEEYKKALAKFKEPSL